MAATITFDSAIPYGEQSLAELRRQCLAMARRRAALSAMASFVPLPGIDLITDVAVLLALLTDINRRFGLTEAQIESLSPSRKALAYKLTTAAGGFVATRMATSQLFLAVLRRAGARLGIMEATRFAPVVGQAVAAAIAYFTLTRIARRHIEQCAEIAAELSA
ncbi:MAG TPA: hypothetical protein VFF82_10405 [Rhodocyclaceae bacterium]|nr:hypothetical protein [Rhodocyclaceae bacterium]